MQLFIFALSLKQTDVLILFSIHNSWHFV